MPFIAKYKLPLFIVIKIWITCKRERHVKWPTLKNFYRKCLFILELSSINMDHCFQAGAYFACLIKIIVTRTRCSSAHLLPLPSCLHPPFREMEVIKVNLTLKKKMILLKINPLLLDQDSKIHK